MAQRVEGWNVFIAADICHGNTENDGGTLPESQAGNTHCPFCRLVMADTTTLLLTLSFPLSEPVTFFVPSVDAALQPHALEMRHAPKHAPPSSFA